MSNLPASKYPTASAPITDTAPGTTTHDNIAAAFAALITATPANQSRVELAPTSADLPPMTMTYTAPPSITTTTQ